MGTLQPQNKGEEPGEGTAMCPMDQARKGTARQPRIGEGRVSIEAAGHLGGAWEAALNVLEVLGSSQPGQLGSAVQV